MNNKQKKEILDNAPEWATHYMTHRYSVAGYYAVCIDGEFRDLMGYEFEDTFWIGISLSDLEQMPFELKTGDKCLYTHNKDCLPLKGEILSLYENTAWVIVDTYPTPITVNLDKLILV